MEKTKKDAILSGILAIGLTGVFIGGCAIDSSNPKWHLLMLAIVNVEPVLRYLLKLEKEKSKLFVFLSGAPAIAAIIVYWLSPSFLDTEEQNSLALFTVFIVILWVAVNIIYSYI
ncbi:MAG: hypothetical protein IKJ57_04305, partial [Oscillospiraceae bacterium]|nr:hypothetical protein [Oscillospiraceae bacterium]